MSNKIIFFAVPDEVLFMEIPPAKPPFISPAVSGGARLIGRGLLRAVPFVGAALTIWEIYDLLDDYFYQPHRGYKLNCNLAGVACFLPRTPVNRYFTGAGATGLCYNHCGQIGSLTLLPVAPGTSTQYVGLARHNGASHYSTAETWEKISGRTFVDFTKPMYIPFQFPDVAPDVMPSPRPEKLPQRVPVPFWPPDPWFSPLEAPAPAPAPSESPQTRPAFPTPLDVPTPNPWPSELPSPSFEVTIRPGFPFPGTQPGTAPNPTPSPKPSPRPAPGGAPPPVPLPPQPLPSKPAPGTKERKFRSKLNPLALLDAASEGAELVDCLYSAIPSVAKAASARQAFGEQMREFWADYNSAKKAGKLGNPQARAKFLTKKPRWNKEWANPIKATEKARAKSWIDNSKGRGIDFVDAKMKVIYDRFDEIDGATMVDAVQCAVINHFVDIAVARSLPRRNVNEALRKLSRR